MRGRKLPFWGSRDKYNQGPATGLPTKVYPPTAIWENGFIPGDPVAAQYDSFWRHHSGRQLELGARLPFRNIVSCGSYPTHPLAATYAPVLGATYFATAENNKIVYRPNFSSASPTAVTLTPAAGTFVPRTVVTDPFFGLVFAFGTNATAPLKSCWTFQDPSADGSERTMPVSGGCYAAAVDRVTQQIHAFFDDASRSVYSTNPLFSPGDLSTLSATRAAGPALGGVTSRVAVNNNVALIARVDSGTVVLDTATLSASAPPTTWATYSLIPVDGPSPSTVYDLTWSDSYNCWLLHGGDYIYAFTNPAGPYTAYLTTNGGSGIVTGALIDVGSLALGVVPTTSFRDVWIRDDLEDPASYLTEKHSLGSGFTGNGFMLNDGSAIWFCGGAAGDPASVWLRTLRVS